MPLDRTGPHPIVRYSENTFVAQHPEERRLRRLAAAYRKDAIVLGRRDHVLWNELLSIELSQLRCRYCEVGLEIGHGTFDHAIPLDRGGPNQLFNIVRCCYRCQREKGTKTPQEYELSKTLTAVCEMCGKVFHPRWAEYQAGRSRLCSRSCNARKRWSMS